MLLQLQSGNIQNFPQQWQVNWKILVNNYIRSCQTSMDETSEKSPIIQADSADQKYKVGSNNIN